MGRKLSKSSNKDNTTRIPQNLEVGENCGSNNQISSHEPESVDDIIQEEVAQDQPEFQNPFHDQKWTKDHPATNIIGNLEECVRTRSATANECLCAGFLSKI